MPLRDYPPNKKGVVYVYDISYPRDPATNKVCEKRKMIGHRDPVTGDIVPNRSYKKRNPASTVEDGVCTVLSTGTSVFLDKIANDTHLSQTLQKQFPEDWKNILSCAYFLVSENKALSNLDQWQAGHKLPADQSLASQRISELIRRIKEGDAKDFLKRWFKENDPTGYYALDITSISTYGKQNESVGWGYNRDKEALEQINLLMVTSETTGIPVYYRDLQGPIKDVSTIRNTLEEFALLDIKKVKFITDKGFYSESNVDEMYKTHSKFLMGVPFTTTLAKNAVEKCRGTIVSITNRLQLGEDRLYGTGWLDKRDGHRLYVHAYYDELKYIRDKQKFEDQLMDCMDALQNGTNLDEVKKSWQKYFVVKDTPKRGRQISYNEEEIQNHYKNVCGWLVLISNFVKDPNEAICIYRGKDPVEKCFDNLKNDLDMKRLRVWEKEAMDGRLLIQFVACILEMKIRRIMKENKLDRKYTLDEVMMGLKAFREISVKGKRKTLKTEMTPFQRELVKAFGLE